MDLTDVTPENFFKKVSYSSASEEEKEGKIVISNGLFIQCAIHLRLVDEIIRLRGALK